MQKVKCLHILIDHRMVRDSLSTQLLRAQTFILFAMKSKLLLKRQIARVIFQIYSIGGSANMRRIFSLHKIMVDDKNLFMRRRGFI